MGWPHSVCCLRSVCTGNRARGRPGSTRSGVAHLGCAFTVCRHRSPPIVMSATTVRGSTRTRRRSPTSRSPPASRRLFRTRADFALSISYGPSRTGPARFTRPLDARLRPALSSNEPNALWHGRLLSPDQRPVLRDDLWRPLLIGALHNSQPVAPRGCEIRLVFQQQDVRATEAPKHGDMNPP
jgi:hypothetical protein